MGPVCEVLLDNDGPEICDGIDLVLASITDTLQRTRNGRSWNLWINERPISAVVTADPPLLTLSAGLKQREDYELLRELASRVIAKVGGVSTDPTT